VKQSDRKVKNADWAGFDLSTTGLGLGVRSRGGSEAFAQVSIAGVTKWKGQPAFDLAHTPRMICQLLDRLESDGWTFGKTTLSFAVRQHDMVLLGQDGQRLIPALSWQCNAADREVLALRKSGAEDVVGRIEERFILPKLMWALKQAPALRRRVGQVMTTGDWIAQELTGKARLSASDALSNGLLIQKNKRLAASVIQAAKLNPDWFPRVIPSGKLVGRIATGRQADEKTDWAIVRRRLGGGRVVSGLGDNHATGVGCGLAVDDLETMVISAGTSGTVNRVCSPKADLTGNAACFEYYENRLLLMMLADCCKWYDRFVAGCPARYSAQLDQLNTLAQKAPLAGLRRVLHQDGKETYAPDWGRLSLGQRVASTQLSIMLELLLLVRCMLAEVDGAGAMVRRFVLTGGLSQSPFFQQVFYAGLRVLQPRSKVLISARQGPLRYQTAAYGALLNAMRLEQPDAATKLCRTRPASSPTREAREALQYLLRSFGL